MGFVDLLQIADLGVEVQGNGLATSRAYLKSNRDIVKNALKGYLEAIHFIHANKPESQKVFAKYMRTNDPEVLESSYQNRQQRSDHQLSAGSAQEIATMPCPRLNSASQP
jgi:ABC-type nitrate/sulfonate/bicarbonate transport system substrate-binding protein